MEEGTKGQLWRLGVIAHFTAEWHGWHGGSPRWTEIAMISERTSTRPGKLTKSY